MEECRLTTVLGLIAVIGTLAEPLDKGVAGALPVDGPGSWPSSIGEITRCSSGTSWVVARRGAGLCGNCSSAVSVSSSLKLPIPLSLEDRKALKVFDWLADDIGSATAAGNSLLGLASNENCLGGEAVLEVSSDSDRGNVASWTVPVCIPLFCRSMLALTLVSSNGRHLKSFL